MHHVTLGYALRFVLIAASLLAASSPAAAARFGYGYCYTTPEYVFSEALKRRYPNLIAYYSGVIRVDRDQGSNGPWGEFRKFIEAKGTSRSFTMQCNDNYASYKAAQEALDRSKLSNITVERTGWTNVPAGDTREAPAPPRPAPVRREESRVYVTLPNTTAGSAKPSGQTPLPTASEVAADQAWAKASYDRQRARDEAEYRRVADENARRQAAYRAEIARQQAEYQAALAARDAEAARIRADWEARVARCKAGDKKFCGSQAIER